MVLQAVRQLHYQYSLGLTAADEMLYPANRIDRDLVSYHAVGARSVEDQEHQFCSTDDASGNETTSGNLSSMLYHLCSHRKQTFLFHGQGGWSFRE